MTSCLLLPIRSLECSTAHQSFGSYLAQPDQWPEIAAYHGNDNVASTFTKAPCTERRRAAARFTRTNGVTRTSSHSEVRAGAWAGLIE